jgi:hypothetical protein
MRESVSTGPLLAEAIPELAVELTALLEEAGEADLAIQVSELRLVDRCRCGDDFCATIYTVPPPQDAWGPGHENVVLNPAQGDLILDVVDRRITCVEVLFRDEVRNRVLALLP